MKKILISSVLFFLCSNSFAENWFPFVDGEYYVDRDSFLILQNPKRVTFRTKLVVEPNKEYYMFYRTINCETAQEYIFNASLHDKNHNFISGVSTPGLKNKEDIRANSVEYVLYKIHCLNK